MFWTSGCIKPPVLARYFSIKWVQHPAVLRGFFGLSRMLDENTVLSLWIPLPRGPEQRNNKDLSIKKSRAIVGHPRPDLPSHQPQAASRPSPLEVTGCQRPSQPSQANNRPTRFKMYWTMMYSENKYQKSIRNPTSFPPSQAALPSQPLGAQAKLVGALAGWRHSGPMATSNPGCSKTARDLCTKTDEFWEFFLSISDSPCLD